MRSNLKIYLSSALLAWVGLVHAGATGSAKALEPRCVQAPCFSAEFTASLERRDGLLPVYLDRRGGRVLVALRGAGPDGELGRYLYQVYLRSGLGSTPVGLDRSAAAGTQIVAFRRAGKNVYAELVNHAFRASFGSGAEQQAVRESFASSLVWSSPIVAESPDGFVLVDLTGFLTRDAFGAADALSAAHQGEFKMAAPLSYPDVAATQVFPENLEFEAVDTFSSDKPGSEVRGTVPDAHALTLTEHHSLIKLPDPGFTPRRADPRTGAIASVVADYSTPLGDPVVYRLAHRFRLEKTDPTAARSTVKKPIVFYVDRAAPEGVRKALIEGARWWAGAFDAAGFIDAFRVEVLPDGVSPLDARYNVINWVHRQTRGWSYGENIIDPRTGEIVKGAVLLGSLRVRQDRMIFEGLAGATQTGSGGPDDPIEVSYSRLRQLAVHETGHALGLEHNFAGSSYDDRASVMDYPPPRIRIKEGRLDFSDAYKVGIGSWDRFALHWLYEQTAPGVDETKALEALVRKAYSEGARFVADGDARPVGSMHPEGSLWDDGTDPVDGLQHVLDIRRIALTHFGIQNISSGAPLYELRRVIVPVYLFHRYQVDAVAKLVGGAYFTYATKDDGLSASRAVSGSEQRRALKALLSTVEPTVLDLSAELIALLSAGEPDTSDVQRERELFGGPRPPTFSLDAAAAAAADGTFDALFVPSRLNRVLEQSAADPGQLGVSGLLNEAIETVFFSKGPASAHRSQLKRTVEARLVSALLKAQRHRSLQASVAADIRAALTALAHRLESVRDGDPEDVSFARYCAELLLSPAPDRIHAYLENEAQGHASPPPGMPIGMESDDDWFADLDPGV